MFDKDDQDISQIIDAGLQAILSGRATVDSFVEQHPDLAEIIRPELETALWIVDRQSQVQPRPGFLPASRARVLARIKDEAASRGTKRAFFGIAVPHPRFTFQWAAVLLVVILLFSGTGGVLSISQGSLPGDSLYSVKRFSEDFSYSVTTDALARLELNSRHAERRLSEVEALVTRGAYDQVESTLNDFETEVNQAVEVLQVVRSAPLSRTEILVQNLAEDLSNQAERLDALAEISPEVVRADLQQAEQVSLSGASAAFQALDDIHLFTRTPTSTATPTMTGTPTAVPTETPVPPSRPTMSHTPVHDPDTPTFEEVIEERADETVSPEEITDPRVTKTPRPTNVNRPTKQVDPSGKNPQDDPKPDKEEKPPKDKNSKSD